MERCQLVKSVKQTISDFGPIMNYVWGCNTNLSAFFCLTFRSMPNMILVNYLLGREIYHGSVRFITAKGKSSFHSKFPPLRPHQLSEICIIKFGDPPPKYRLPVTLQYLLYPFTLLPIPVLKYGTGETKERKFWTELEDYLRSWTIN